MAERSFAIHTIHIVIPISFDPDLPFTVLSYHAQANVSYVYPIDKAGIIPPAFSTQEDVDLAEAIDLVVKLSASKVGRYETD